MKRSHINDIIAQARALISQFQITLPPFANWSPEQMRARAQTADHLIKSRCGWDVTDYGAGDFDHMGLTLFTLRNGNLADLHQGRGMCYAEKLLISRANQLSPMHTHRLKAEDIINRGGAPLIVELYASNPEGQLDDTAKGCVLRDGEAIAYDAGTRLCLDPGESVTLRPGDWHAFWAEDGDVLIGEVSTVNNDETDNVFRDPIGRFATIDEDTTPDHLLVSDYPTWLA